MITRNGTGVWLAPRKQWRFMTPLSGHDAFYLALGTFRARWIVR